MKQNNKTSIFQHIKLFIPSALFLTVTMAVTLLITSTQAVANPIVAHQASSDRQLGAIILSGTQYNITVPGLYKRSDLISREDARHYEKIRAIFSPETADINYQIRAEEIVSGLAYSTQSTLPMSHMQCQSGLPDNPEHVIYLCLDPRTTKMSCGNCAAPDENRANTTAPRKIVKETCVWPCSEPPPAERPGQINIGYKK